MKKQLSIITLSLMLTILLSFTSNAFATDTTATDTKAKLTMEERVENLITRFEEKATATYEEKSTKWETFGTEILERHQQFISVVSTYVPDMVDEFEAIYDEHVAVHKELFSTKAELHYEYATETIDELRSLATELQEDIEADEITKQEAISSLKSYVTERKTNYEDMKTEYLEMIQEKEDEWAVSQEAVKVLRTELRTALAAEDTETIDDIIPQLYDYSVEHVAYDQYKLDVLKVYFEVE